MWFNWMSMWCKWMFMRSKWIFMWFNWVDLLPKEIVILPAKNGLSTHNGNLANYNGDLTMKILRIQFLTNKHGGVTSPFSGFHGKIIELEGRFVIATFDYRMAKWQIWIILGYPFFNCKYTPIHVRYIVYIYIYLYVFTHIYIYE